MHAGRLPFITAVAIAASLAASLAGQTGPPSGASFGGDQDYFFRAVKTLPALLEQHGFIFVGATHGGMIEPTTPQVLDFFAAHARGRRTK